MRGYISIYLLFFFLTFSLSSNIHSECISEPSSRENESLYVPERRDRWRRVPRITCDSPVNLSICYVHIFHEISSPMQLCDKWRGSLFFLLPLSSLFHHSHINTPVMVWMPLALSIEVRGQFHWFVCLWIASYCTRFSRTVCFATNIQLITCQLTGDEIHSLHLMCTKWSAVDMCEQCHLVSSTDHLGDDTRDWERGDKLRVKTSVHVGRWERQISEYYASLMTHSLHCNEADEKCVFTKVHQSYFIYSRDACVCSNKNTRQLLNELAQSVSHEWTSRSMKTSFHSVLFTRNVRYTWDLTEPLIAPAISFFLSSFFFFLFSFLFFFFFFFHFLLSQVPLH